LIPALARDGFVLDRQSGAHQLYLHADWRRVTVTFHRPGVTFEIKTLRTIIEIQAHWTDEDLRRLKSIRSLRQVGKTSRASSATENRHEKPKKNDDEDALSDRVASS
jgi:predicted RNA binding protein YcfA (HicA-like mRNA interferase family)